MLVFHHFTGSDGTRMHVVLEERTVVIFPRKTCLLNNFISAEGWTLGDTENLKAYEYRSESETNQLDKQCCLKQVLIFNERINASHMNCKSRMNCKLKTNKSTHTLIDFCICKALFTIL